MQLTLEEQAYEKLLDTQLDVPKIVPATLYDIPYLMEASEEGRDAVGFIPEVRYKEIIEKNRYAEKLLICFKNDKPIGFCYTSHNNTGTMRIYQVYVDPKMRRRSYGTKLISESVSERDIRMTVRYASDLEDATKFWKALGFAPSGKKVAVTKKGRHMITYEKYITDGNQLSLFG